MWSLPRASLRKAGSALADEEVEVNSRSEVCVGPFRTRRFCLSPFGLGGRGGE